MQQTSVKEVGMSGRKGDSMGIVQEIEFWLHYQVVYAQTRIRPRE